MITLGKITTNYQTLEMGFREQDGKKDVLRGMSIGAPRKVSTKRMERIFIHGEVSYAAECLITTHKDLEGRQEYHTEIKNLLG
jgi:predicted secreted protein